MPMFLFSFSFLFAFIEPLNVYWGIIFLKIEQYVWILPMNIFMVNMTNELSDVCLYLVKKKT